MSADYIARTIETVRQHRDSENSWPQWANVLADRVEELEREKAWYEDLAQTNWDLYESRGPRIEQLMARVALLDEFFQAFEIVEAGIVDFDLHNDAVMRLRAAREALYRSGAAGTANESSRSPAGTDSAAPEKQPWGPDHPSYDEMGQ